MAWDTHVVVARLVAEAHLVVTQDNLASLVVDLGNSLDTHLVVAQDTLVASHLVDLGNSLDSQTTLVVVEVPEGGVALEGAVRPQDRSYATGVVGQATSLPIVKMLQQMW